jgi:RNA polymerase sigma-70 factor (ECF subfamily)
VSDRALESTATLLDRLRDGDDGAREQIMARCLPALRRWAHGRMPAGRRDLSETDDLVQAALMRSMNHLDAFDAAAPGALFGYLRQIVLNLMRDEYRAVARQPRREMLDVDTADEAPGVLDLAIGSETVDAYERALGKLNEMQRNAVVLRLEFGFSYAEMAAEMDLPSSDAARMLVSRALVRVAQLMS